MKRIAVAAAVLMGLTGPASANGRDPFTSSIHFRHGNDQHVIGGMTFGLTVSDDGGATWRWMCEAAVGYGGTYDPDYEFSASGAIFATTFDGLKVMRDGCSFNATPPGMTFVSKVEIGPDGDVFFAAADPTDAKILRSSDDGVTFPQSADPGQPNDWWQSLIIAPSDATRVYIAGYRLDGGNPKQFLLFRSSDRAASFEAMTLTGITPVSPNSTIDLVGVSPTDPDTLYAHVTLESGTMGDSIYKSTDAGASWTKILTKEDRFGLSFLARADGTCVAGTRASGAWVSANCDATWSELTTAPRIGCLSENAAGEVWACTQNYANPLIGVESDGYGIMKSTDLATWTGVLRYQDIQAPVACPAGTIQEDRCVQRYMGQQSQWCCLVPQLGITSTAIDCTGPLQCFGDVIDGVPDAGPTMVKPPEGCCDTGGGGAPAGGLAALVGALLFRRRRTKER
jgi:uncharacterized protein (TIGR03382 family)